MIRFHPSREPVAWLTLLGVVIQIVIGILTHHLDVATWTTLTTALTGVGIRQSVWSPSSHEGGVADAIAQVIGELDH